MPTYQFKDEDNGDEFEIELRISELDEFKKDNPSFKQLLTGAPGIVAGVGGMRNDDGWNEQLSRIAEAHPTSKLAERYGKKDPKTVKTREALDKWRKNRNV